MSDGTKRDQPVVTVEYEACQGYRAELWIRPYRGHRIAATEYRTRKSDAVRDAKRIFQATRPFEILP